MKCTAMIWKSNIGCAVLLSKSYLNKQTEAINEQIVACACYQILLSKDLDGNIIASFCAVVKQKTWHWK